jgi:hypothetical protein
VLALRPGAKLRIDRGLQAIDDRGQVRGTSAATVVGVQHRTQVMKPILGGVDRDHDHLLDHREIEEAVERVVEVPDAERIRRSGPQRLTILRVDHRIPLGLLLVVRRRHQDLVGERVVPVRDGRGWQELAVRSIERGLQQQVVTGVDRVIPTLRPVLVTANELDLERLAFRQAEDEPVVVPIGAGRRCGVLP